VTEPPAAALGVDVSRETSERLAALRDLVLKWNRRINLVAHGSEADLWVRHIVDSAQLWPLRQPAARTWVDLGSGAGFPGLVVAALAATDAPDLRMTLVESDGRKAAFLGEAARVLGLVVTVRAERIEALPPLRADVVSARALAPLSRLLGHLAKHRAPDGIGLFPKGETVHKEIEDAAARWRFQHRIHRSVTSSGAAIVEVGAVSSA
jgi:16S rRNA (guanine527-N7)-methyltransferase